MCKAKVLTCIDPEARIRRNPSPSRSTPLDFSKCYRMCANGVVTTSEIASTHGKTVAVRFVPFAVPGCRTAKLPFPVVTRECINLEERSMEIFFIFFKYTILNLKNLIFFLILCRL
jgi:hypothetical protein